MKSQEKGSETWSAHSQTIFSHIQQFEEDINKRSLSPIQNWAEFGNFADTYLCAVCQVPTEPHLLGFWALQGWWLHPFPGHPDPVLDNPSSEKCPSFNPNLPQGTWGHFPLSVPVLWEQSPGCSSCWGLRDANNVPTICHTHCDTGASPKPHTQLSIRDMGRKDQSPWSFGVKTWQNSPCWPCITTLGAAFSPFLWVPHSSPGMESGVLQPHASPAGKSHCPKGAWGTSQPLQRGFASGQHCLE